MGTFKVRAKIWRIISPENSREIELIVDTGSTRTGARVLQAFSLGVNGAKTLNILQ